MWLICILAATTSKINKYKQQSTCITNCLKECRYVRRKCYSKKKYYFSLEHLSF